MNSEIIARFIAQGCGFSIRKLSEDKNCIAFEFMEKKTSGQFTRELLAEEVDSAG
jgi:hypothetical protein